MAETSRWAELPQLCGWRVLRTIHQLRRERSKVRRERLAECAIYQDWGRTELGRWQPTPEQEQQYGRLNWQLHERINQAAQLHFKGTPAPPGYDEAKLANAWKYRTPFTYQNYDWYTPSYACTVAVLENSISASLLIAFQKLLTDEWKEWCVVVGGCKDIDFGDEGQDFYVFSDAVLIDSTTAKSLALYEAGQFRISWQGIVDSRSP